MKHSIKIAAALSSVLLAGATTSFAKIGDVAGTALHTDIVAYINHYALPSYAANGQSVIVAEDLKSFGFDVTWDNNNRSLTITRNPDKTIYGTTTVDKSNIPGTKFADILETDIKVYANNTQLTSYALNGYTLIPLEELNVFGNVYWVESERAVKLWVDGLHALAYRQDVKITPIELVNKNGQRVSVLPKDYNAYINAGWYKPSTPELTDYARELPWVHDKQVMAIIKLNIGPYGNWAQNRDYYLRQYFPINYDEIKNSITHYADSDSILYHNYYLFIPRYKTSTSVVDLKYDWDNLRILEDGVLKTIPNGAPFTLKYNSPARDGGEMFRIYSGGKECLTEYEYYGDDPQTPYRFAELLDLTNWSYY